MSLVTVKISCLLFVFLALYIFVGFIVWFYSSLKRSSNRGSCPDTIPFDRSLFDTAVSYKGITTCDDKLEGFLKRWQVAQLAVIPDTKLQFKSIAMPLRPTTTMIKNWAKYLLDVAYQSNNFKHISKLNRHPIRQTVAPLSSFSTQKTVHPAEYLKAPSTTYTYSRFQKKVKRTKKTSFEQQDQIVNLLRSRHSDISLNYNGVDKRHNLHTVDPPQFYLPDRLTLIYPGDILVSSFIKPPRAYKQEICIVEPILLAGNSFIVRKEMRRALILLDDLWVLPLKTFTPQQLDKSGSCGIVSSLKWGSVKNNTIADHNPRTYTAEYHDPSAPLYANIVLSPEEIPEPGQQGQDDYDWGKCKKFGNLNNLRAICCAMRTHLVNIQSRRSTVIDGLNLQLRTINHILQEVSKKAKIYYVANNYTSSNELRPGTALRKFDEECLLRTILHQSSDSRYWRYDDQLYHQKKYSGFHLVFSNRDKNYKQLLQKLQMMDLQAIKNGIDNLQGRTEHRTVSSRIYQLLSSLISVDENWESFFWDGPVGYCSGSIYPGRKAALLPFLRKTKKELLYMLDLLHNQAAETASTYKVLTNIESRIERLPTLSKLPSICPIYNDYNKVAFEPLLNDYPRRYSKETEMSVDELGEDLTEKAVIRFLMIDTSGKPIENTNGIEWILIRSKYAMDRLQHCWRTKYFHIGEEVRKSNAVSFYGGFQLTPGLNKTEQFPELLPTNLVDRWQSIPKGRSVDLEYQLPLPYNSTPIDKFQGIKLLKPGITSVIPPREPL